MNIETLAILQRLAQHFRLKNTGNAVAQFLGVSSSQVVYNWRMRNNIDLHLVVTAARTADPSISLNWLIYGEGSTQRQPDRDKPLRHPEQVEGIQHITNVIITNDVFSLEDFVEFVEEKRRRKQGYDTTPDGEVPPAS